jgi:putative DNA primase/helicase
MQCPLAFVAVTVLVALGAVIGRQVSIRPKMKDAWTVVVNLWGMVIGSPGTLKTPAMNEGLKPLDRLAAQARESFKLAQAEYDLKARVAKTRTAENEKQAGKEAAKKDANTAIIEGLLKPVLPEGEEPIQKRYTTVKATGEALAVLCRQNPNGILVKVDELLSLLDRLDEEGHSDERALYLTGWDGNTSHTDDRIGRGLDLHVPSLTISLFGSTQPARISQSSTNSAAAVAPTMGSSSGYS